MSDALALAAVTATLRRLLRSKVGQSVNGRQIDVTTINPARFVTATGNDDHILLNLFLYQMLPNAAWRNQSPPGAKPGQTVLAPLALDLYYLLTAYTAGDELAFETQQVLGLALAALHDIPILGAESVKLNDPGPAEDLLGERIRITPVPLSVDDISKLWSAFQAPYLTSAAFQASVVLIESGRALRTAPPVLSRGESNGKTDPGPTASANLTPRYPTVTGLDLAVPADDLARRRRPAAQPVFEADELVRILGSGLRVRPRTARVLLSPAGGAPACVLVAPDPTSTADALTVRLRAAAGSPPLRAGFHTLVVEVDTGDLLNPKRLSNEVPLMLAPTIVDVQPPGPVAPTASVNVTCAPPLRAGQRAALLVGAAAVPLAAFADGATVLSFDLTPAALATGQTYPVRLRVDGVDSLAVAADNPFAFARTLEVA
jgi:hypothetical protein